MWCEERSCAAIGPPFGGFFEQPRDGDEAGCVAMSEPERTEEPSDTPDPRSDHLPEVDEIKRAHPELQERLRTYRERRRAYEILRTKSRRQLRIAGAKMSGTTQDPWPPLHKSTRLSKHDMRAKLS